MRGGSWSRASRSRWASLRSMLGGISGGLAACICSDNRQKRSLRLPSFAVRRQAPRAGPYLSSSLYLMSVREFWHENFGRTENLLAACRSYPRLPRSQRLRCANGAMTQNHLDAVRRPRFRISKRVQVQTQSRSDIRQPFPHRQEIVGEHISGCRQGNP